MKFNIVVVLFVLINFSSVVFPAIIFDIDPDYKDCPGVVNDIFDLSKLEIIPINDSATFLNGPFKILNEIKSPFKVLFTTKRLIKGQWVKGELNKHIIDFCLTMKNRLDVFYPIAKHFKSRCPTKAGVKLY